MKNKDLLKFFSQMFFGGMIGITLFVGVIRVFADYPTTPNGTNEVGWLGTIFNVITSGEEFLSVKSKKLILPTEISDINLTKQVPTKEYVDNRVAAVGGSSVVINGSIMPTMISDLSPKTKLFTWHKAAAYCRDLNEQGYSNWRVPTREELIYAVSGGIDPIINDSVYLWTSSRADVSISGESTSSFICLKPSIGLWNWNVTVQQFVSPGYINYFYYYVRCVR